MKLCHSNKVENISYHDFQKTLYFMYVARETGDRVIFWAESLGHLKNLEK